MNLAGGLRELLRPPPHRGPLIAAGAVALGVGIALEEIRLSSALPAGVHLAILLLCGPLLYWLGAQAPNEDGVPPAYQSVLLVTGLLLTYGGLLKLAGVLGAGFGGTPAGALVWTSALTAGLALWPALERNSAICLLLSAIFTTLALIAAWAWVFSPHSLTPYRWILLALAAVFVLGGLALREPAPRHAELLTVAAGLAIAAIGVTGLVGVFGDPAHMSELWSIALAAAGFGSLAFGALERSPGPAYVGVLNLGLFIAVVGFGHGATLYWWPLVLLVAGGGAVAVGLRPRRPLPPEPPAYRAGEAPLASRADADEVVVQVRED